MEVQNKGSESNDAVNGLFGNLKENKDKDGASIKSKRDEYSTEIKKKNREEQLMAKRRPQIKDVNKLQALENAGIKLDANTAALKEYVDKVLQEKFTMQDFFQILNCINSQDRFEQHRGVIGLRKILSIDNPPIQPVIDSNLVPRLIEFMQNDKEPHLQLESAWALTNVASGTTQQTQSIIDKGGIPLFVKLLNSPNTEVAEQAIWAIGNISGDSTLYRNMILNAGGLKPMINLLTTSGNKHTIKHGTWALSNLCRGRPAPRFELVKEAIVPLAQVMKEEEDPEILTDAAWALSYLSDGDEDVVQLVVDTGVVPALIKHLGHSFLSILIPCLRTIGNIVTGNVTQTNLVMSFPGIASMFLELLHHDKKPVRRETCWVLSNITAGTPEQIAVLLSCPGFITKLRSLALTDSAEVKRESTWVLSNSVSYGNDELIKLLVDNGIIETMVDLLNTAEDPKIITVALESIHKILLCGLKYQNTSNKNPFLDHLESLGAVPIIEKLQEHKSDDVYKASLKILENFFILNEPI